MNEIQQQVWKNLLLGGGDLRVFYQPLKRPSQLGEDAFMFEALIRWIIDGKVVTADKFIPEILKVDAIAIALDEWVIRSVLIDLRYWKSVRNLRIKVAVNLTAASLHDLSLPARIYDLVEGCVEPRLILEVMESQKLEFNTVRSNVDSLKLMSPIILDDLGVGYSNLDSIVNLAIDGIKINGSFLVRILDSSKHKAVVRAILQICHELQLMCVAEWIESLDLAACISSMAKDYPKCDLFLQGYIVGLPAPLEQHFGHDHMSDLG